MSHWVTRNSLRSFWWITLYYMLILCIKKRQINAYSNCEMIFKLTIFCWTRIIKFINYFIYYLEPWWIKLRVRFNFHMSITSWGQYLKWFRSLYDFENVTRSQVYIHQTTNNNGYMWCIINKTVPERYIY